ncbi:hypothetical protein P153DRAFT_159156 [Dothidotthia symphoricarpi CBS 119687]|uniref:Uncharacterized protein n=1 Tax=Dothidotthia symphoricarpi CBS 119687 TaxID=1392245 RepID=A0A6A6AQV9_9PLEO|nr:uncharacterized protein P153DRAFT_159156 [Dothidotthia symphoricarpi CBS 119687]KAF2133558.1 hypothetical protein P153DRAFT_159156 [Dothidotthia symphoricarpi CBS 119687]
MRRRRGDTSLWRLCGRGLLTCDVRTALVCCFTGHATLDKDNRGQAGTSSGKTGPGQVKDDGSLGSAMHLALTLGLLLFGWLARAGPLLSLTIVIPVHVSASPTWSTHTSRETAWELDVTA